MLNKLFSSRGGELKLADCISHPNASTWFPGSQLQVAANNQDCQFIFQEFTGPSFKARISQFASKARETYTWVSDPMITLRMGINQSHIFNLPHLGKQVFHQRDFNLLHIPHFSVEFTLGPAETVRFIDVIVTEEYLRSMETDYPLLLQEFLFKTARRAPAKLSAQNPVATTEILRWVDKLMHFSPQAGNVHEQSCKTVSQLFHNCLTVMNECPLRKSTKMNLQEIDKLYRVAEFLEASPENMPVTQLADKFKISAYKLEKGFKEIFGYSVLHHSFEEKMRLAFRLMEENKYRGKQVAELLRYSDSQSFSRAFKRRFGYAPYRNAPKS